MSENRSPREREGIRTYKGREHVLESISNEYKFEEMHISMHTPEHLKELLEKFISLC